jgi:glycosyltransferase involved in cell wall biosynthesis
MNCSMRSLDAATADFDPFPSGMPEGAFDLVVADASWVWTERLFAPLAEMGIRVLMLKACDWRTAWSRGLRTRDWNTPLRPVGPNRWERSLVLPPGWMKTYPRWGMRPIASAVRGWRDSLRSPRPLALAISYPHYLYLRDQVRPDALMYYNMDDYALYWPSRAQAVRRLERQAVREADLSVFCARVRAEELSAEMPEAAGRIIHLPHGAPLRSIPPGPLHRPSAPPPDLARLPGPRLGFVGSLEDRIDWPLVEQTARAFPTASVVLVGQEPVPAPQEAWYRDYLKAASLPNVHRLGWKPQSEIGTYMAAFDVCLIPYRVDHPFNRAACPTKVMDYMASTRPVVSTALPECQLYDHLFDVEATDEDFLEAIRRIVVRDGNDDRAGRRWTQARMSTWERTAGRLLEEFERAMATGKG